MILHAWDFHLRKERQSKENPIKRTPELLHAYYILLLGDRGEMLKDKAKLSDTS